jgi:hypothetical protein
MLEIDANRLHQARKSLIELWRDQPLTILILGDSLSEGSRRDDIIPVDFGPDTTVEDVPVKPDNV